jgi:hypothetical protein
MWRLSLSAVGALALTAAVLAAEEYKNATVKGRERAAVLLDVGGKEVRVLTDLGMKAYDAEGKQLKADKDSPTDYIAGLRALKDGNVLDVTTAKGRDGRTEVIREIRLVEGELLKPGPPAKAERRGAPGKAKGPGDGMKGPGDGGPPPPLGKAMPEGGLPRPGGRGGEGSPDQPPRKGPPEGGPPAKAEPASPKPEPTTPDAEPEVKSYRNAVVRRADDERIVLALPGGKQVTLQPGPSMRAYDTNGRALRKEASFRALKAGNVVDVKVEKAGNRETVVEVRLVRGDL